MGKLTKLDQIARKEKLREQAVALHERGVKPDEIARRLGVKRQGSVSTWLAERKEPMSAAEVKAHKWRMAELARRTSTNLYGDPPPGRSALDQKRQSHGTA